MLILAVAQYDIGVYPLMCSYLISDGKIGAEASNPDVKATMIMIEGIDYEDVIVKYYKTNRIGILTASLRARRREDFLRVKGSKGVTTVSGPGCSVPRKLKIQVDGSRRGKWSTRIRGRDFISRRMRWRGIYLRGGMKVQLFRFGKRSEILGLWDDIRKQSGVSIHRTNRAEFFPSVMQAT